MERKTVKVRGKMTEITSELRPDVAVVIAQLPDGKLLLEKQYRHSLDKNLYEFPAGHADLGEDPKDTARRELEEETGYKAPRLSLLTSLYWSPGRSSQVFHFYYAKVLEKSKKHLDGTEIIKLISFSEKELDGMVRKGTITDAKTVLGILFYQKYLQKKT